MAEASFMKILFYYSTSNPELPAFTAETVQGHSWIHFHQPPASVHSHSPAYFDDQQYAELDTLKAEWHAATVEGAAPVLASVVEGDFETGVGESEFADLADFDCWIDHGAVVLKQLVVVAFVLEASVVVQI